MAPSKKSEKVWVVRAGDTLASILAKTKEEGAIEEGRVFVGKKRLTRGDEPLQAGATVRIGAKPAASTSIDIPILLDQDGLVACIKPAGIATVPDHAGSHSLVHVVSQKTGKRDLRITSRLDREVSGVVVFAVDAEAEDRLKLARAEHRYERRYVAIAESSSLPDVGTWDSAIEDKPSTSRYRVVDQASGHSLVAVDPQTGRTHQIRIHASRAGAPLLGDPTYGGHGRLTLPNGAVIAPTRIALHAARVVVPGKTEAIELRAPIPAELERLWAALGGEPEAWNRAVSCVTS